MQRVVPTTPGLFPLPDWAKEELSNLKGHQKEDLIGGEEGPDVTEAYRRAREEVIGVQQELGFDLVVGGQLRWDDMLAHPLAVHDAVDTRGIVRYYNNNNFYRDPVVRDELTPDGDVAAELEAAVDLVEEDLQAVLPGPYTLADLATDEYYGDEAAFVDGVATFLAGEVEQFPAVETLFLLEPSLVTDPPTGDAPERASAAVDAVASVADADVVLYTYWDGFEDETYAHLLDADVDAVGFDLVSDPDGNAYVAGEYGTTDDVALGVVDGQNTLIETPETVRERIEWFETRSGTTYDTVYATANTELFYLPVSKFEAKLETLARAAQLEVEA